MGRPPKIEREGKAKRPGPTKAEAAALTLLAMGVASWGLVIELLIFLERKKVISKKQSERIIVGAAGALRAMDEMGPHAGIKVAYSLLEGQLDAWKNELKRR
jgi:predicted peroxiredoxin